LKPATVHGAENAGAPRDWLAEEHISVPAQCDFSGISYSNILMGVSNKLALAYAAGAGRSDCASQLY